jgi:hypothetical protein
MDLSYLLMPFFAWLVAGGSKFVINCVRERRMAFDLIGYGGMPSNHSAIVSSVAALIALREGLDHPAFAVAVGLAFVVMLDANSLRRQVGRHAQQINRLHRQAGAPLQTSPLRERMGHSKLEIGTGILVGIVSALLLNAVSPWLTVAAWV